MRRLTLPDALHARPANLLAQLASRHAAVVVVTFRGRTADASRILEVLALGAMRGDEIDLDATGDAAEAALAAVIDLIERGFDRDLVPELGTSVVEGVAIGRAVLVEGELAGRASLTDFEEAAAVAARSLEATIASLPPSEAELFEPERAILDELVERVRGRANAGESVQNALEAEVEVTVTDLLRDAHDRLTRALATGGAEAGRPTQGDGGDVVIVADHVTPSLVAELAPGVVGIVAGQEAGTHGMFTSHAAILARGRGLPLVFVPPHVVHAIVEDDLVVLDTTAREARIWVAPGDDLLDRIRTKRVALEVARAEAATAGARARPRVPVRVNVGSVADLVPDMADGIGLVRTELLFAAWDRAPSEDEQYFALESIAGRARGGIVCVRLFDAGGDKPLHWVRPPETDREARGMALLFHHGELLDAQLRAIGRARSNADLRALIPLVRHAEDVTAVRARSPAGVPIGAMIETPEAAAAIDRIASEADFLCIGTNDLAAALLGVGRAEALAAALDDRVADVVARVVERAHAHGRAVTVCGEAAADPEAARRLVALGVDALSVAPSHVAKIRLALAAVSEEDRAS